MKTTISLKVNKKSYKIHDAIYYVVGMMGIFQEESQSFVSSTEILEPFLYFIGQVGEVSRPFPPLGFRVFWRTKDHFLLTSPDWSFSFVSGSDGLSYLVGHFGKPKDKTLYPGYGWDVTYLPQTSLYIPLPMDALRGTKCHSTLLVEIIIILPCGVCVCIGRHKD